MKKLIEDFHRQPEVALQLAAEVDLMLAGKKFDNVLISGLGGSGIGGSIVADICGSLSSVPIAVNKDYSIPAFVGKNTLFIACSYSGNTEETLSAVKMALSKNAKVVCISSGGELKNLAKENNLPCFTMEGGHPPRSMFGYSFTYLLWILHAAGIAELKIHKEINTAMELLKKEDLEIRKTAESIAERIKDSIPVLYAVHGYLGVATRWRQQLNENAKMLSWAGEIPEMNHNELVGWEGGDDKFACIFLRSQSDATRNQKRIEIIKEIISQKTSTVIEIWSKGETAIQQTLYLIHLGDWISYYLAEKRNVDILDIKSIDLLKSELSKLAE